MNRSDKQRQKTLGLSFSGGGVTSWAEVAVYEELEKEDIDVHAVTGTSMGSFLAAGVASGLSADEIYQIIRDTDQAIYESKLFNQRALLNLISFRRPLGLVLMEKLAEVIKPVSELYDTIMLSDIPKPLAIPAVDIISQKMIVFSNKPEYFDLVYDNAEFYTQDLPLLTACLASSAYPIVLDPVFLGEYQLVDGGVLLSSPAPLLSREKMEYVLSIRTEPAVYTTPADQRNEVALRAIGIMLSKQEELASAYADSQYSFDLNLPSTFDFGYSDSVIHAGRKYVKDNPIDLEGVFTE